jgi:hypothetical protein
MSLPAFSADAPNRSGGFAGEVTRLNCGGQFKPFVYLNGGGSRTEAQMAGLHPSCEEVEGINTPLGEPSLGQVICPTCQNVFRWTAQNIHASGTMLLCMGLFSIFWFGAGTTSRKRKVPPCGGTFLLSLNSVSN